MNLLLASTSSVDLAATGFVLLSASLVFLMTPALALFYGGMTRSVSVLNMLMMSLGAFAVAAVCFVGWGYALAFGPDDLAGIIADPRGRWGLPDASAVVNPLHHPGYGTIPALAYAGFQLVFAGLAVAIISGAIADRVKFSTWLLFTGLWVTIVYFPVVHLVWGGGWLSDAGDGLAAAMFGATGGTARVAPIDFAGGTVVHINAGVAAFVLAVVTGRRHGFGTVHMRPHNVPLTVLGAGLLWFGWYGFNAGSALAADSSAALAWVNSTAAACAALLSWLAVEKRRSGHMTTLGAASGVIAGLVAVTPACGAVSPVGALGIGSVAGALSALAISAKYLLGLDDSLDVVGVHLVSGVWGTVAVGLFATDTGLFYGKGYEQLAVQGAVALACMLFTGVTTAVLAGVLQLRVGWRIHTADELAGIDAAQHAESAYDFGGPPLVHHT